MKLARVPLAKNLYLCEYGHNDDAWIATNLTSKMTNNRAAIIKGCKIAAERGLITVNETFTQATLTPLGKAMMKLIK